MSAHGPDPDLLGVWKPVWTQTNGQPKRQSRELWVFRADSFVMLLDDDDAIEFPLSIDPSTRPKQLEHGIYEVVGDVLRIAQVFPGVPRPTEFETTLGDMRTVTFLERTPLDPYLSIEDLHAHFKSGFGPPPELPPLDDRQFNAEAEKFVTELMRGLDRSARLSERDAVVFHVSWLITDAENGGFYQFFYNSSAGAPDETAISLRKIGACDTARLVEEGCRLFPDGRPGSDYATRQTQLVAFTLEQCETLRALEQQFYTRHEDICLLVKNYWDAHA